MVGSAAQVQYSTQPEEYFEQNGKLAYKIARYYKAKFGWLEWADLLQEAQLALWLAALKYDPGRGVKFSTFAYIVIWRKLCDYAKKESRLNGHGKFILSGLAGEELKWPTYPKYVPRASFGGR